MAEYVLTYPTLKEIRGGLHVFHENVTEQQVLTASCRRRDHRWDTGGGGPEGGARGRGMYSTSNLQLKTRFQDFLRHFSAIYVVVTEKTRPMRQGSRIQQRAGSRETSSMDSRAVYASQEHTKPRFGKRGTSAPEVELDHVLKEPSSRGTGT